MHKSDTSLLFKFGRDLARTARLMVGVPDYDAYVAHRRLDHPGEPVMTLRRILPRAAIEPLRRKRRQDQPLLLKQAGNVDRLRPSAKMEHRCSSAEFSASCWCVSMLTPVLAAELKLRPPPKSFDSYTPPPAPDYADQASWVVWPGRRAQPIRSHPASTAAIAKDPKADVFFIHPTTFLDNSAWNASLRRRRLHRDAARSGCATLPDQRVQRLLPHLRAALPASDAERVSQSRRRREQGL